MKQLENMIARLIAVLTLRQVITKDEQYFILGTITHEELLKRMGGGQL